MTKNNSSKLSKEEIAKTITNKAQNAISNFCIHDCKAYCCRKGYLKLKDSEVDTVTQNRKDKLIKKEILKKLEPNSEEVKKGYSYSLFMGTPNQPCPSLDQNTFKCKIHTSTNRSNTCSAFPIFLHKEKSNENNETKILIHFSRRCLAVKEGKLYPFEKVFLDAGINIVNVEDYS